MKESKLILMQKRLDKLEQQLVGVMKIIASTQGYSRSVAIALQEHLGKDRWEELVKKLEDKEAEKQAELSESDKNIVIKEMLKDEKK
jgi:hypothetical protein